MGMSELGDPLPWRITIPAKVAVLLLFLVVTREYWHGLLESSDWAAEANARAGTRWQRLKASVPGPTWLRLQRIILWAGVLTAVGAIVNVLSDDCSTIFGCILALPTLAAQSVPAAIQLMLYMMLMVGQLGFFFYMMVKVGSFKIVQPGTIRVTFDDVWGQDAAKQKVMEQVKLLEDSREVERAGGHMPKGILLYGPPGTGKTYLAKAAANASSKPLILVPPGAFQATFVGINLLKVWTMFRSVRKLARRYGGVIVFIDEIDSLGSRGGQVAGGKPPAEDSCSEPMPIIMGGMGGGGQMGTLEAFLSAMDGLDEPRGPLNRLLVFLGFKPLKAPEFKYLMMGATNMPQRMDPALLRAGRFGRKIHVDYPKIEGRRRTYEGYLAKVKHTLTPENVDWAARNHAKGSGAEIKDIVNEALLLTYRDDREDPGTIGLKEVIRAMMFIRFGESDGPFERIGASWSVAVHEAGHAVAFHHLARDRAHIWFASIEQHGTTGGMVAPTPLHDDWLKTRTELVNDITIALASRVAEELVFGEQTNGHGGDGRAATENAMAVVRYGGGRYIGAYGSGPEDLEFREAVEDVLGEGLERARDLLRTRKAQVIAVAELLRDEHTVTGDRIHELLEGME
jgi:ATP-dependent Zn protease